MATAKKQLPQQPMIPLASIVIGKSNPRKVFDEDAINELADSVKDKGVIQPIVLRTTDKPDIYELVCGERRYRASLIAGLTEIPATIRELTDDEALELQITENLQRKDVHPMEEAFAIKQMLERFSFLEVAAKLGKKEWYVKQRMKLNDLTPDWQKVFYKGTLHISTALKVSVFPADIQKELFEDKSGGATITINQYTLNQVQGKLNNAPFNLEDLTLNKKAGSCKTCPFNSSVSSLFPDSDKNPICSNRTCFKIKCDTNFQRELKIALADPTILFVSTEYGIDKKIKDIVEKEGSTIIDRYGYSEVKEHDAEAPEWEEFREDNEDDFESEDELRAAFEEDVKDFNDKATEAEKKIATGKYKKAFVVDGDYKGKYTYIEIKKSSSTNTKTASKKAVESGTANAIDIETEITRLKDREKRSKELDEEKIHERVIAALKEAVCTNNLPTAATNVDRILMLYLIQENISYGNQNAIKKVTGLPGNYNRAKPEANYAQLEALTDMQLTYIVRQIAIEKFSSSLSPAHHNGHILRKLAESLGTIPIAAYETEQQEKADKRIKKVNERISELEKQKKELKPKPEKTATKKVVKKAIKK